MEGSILGNKYMNLRGLDALKEFVKLKNICQKVRGGFSLLWHNSELINDERKEDYISVLSA